MLQSSGPAETDKNIEILLAESIRKDESVLKLIDSLRKSNRKKQKEIKSLRRKIKVLENYLNRVEKDDDCSPFSNRRLKPFSQCKHAQRARVTSNVKEYVGAGSNDKDKELKMFCSHYLSTCSIAESEEISKVLIEMPKFAEEIKITRGDSNGIQTSSDESFLTESVVHRIQEGNGLPSKSTAGFGQENIPPNEQISTYSAGKQPEESNTFSIKVPHAPKLGLALKMKNSQIMVDKVDPAVAHPLLSRNLKSGDVVLAVNFEEVKNIIMLQSAIERVSVGGELTFMFLRFKETNSLGNSEERSEDTCATDIPRRRRKYVVYSSSEEEELEEEKGKEVRRPISYSSNDEDARNTIESGNQDFLTQSLGELGVVDHSSEEEGEYLQTLGSEDKSSSEEEEFGERKWDDDYEIEIIPVEEYEELPKACIDVSTIKLSDSEDNVDLRTVVEEIPSNSDKEQNRFMEQREKLSQEYYEHFNDKAFGKKLPAQMKITWKKRMKSTAGRTKLHKRGKSEYAAEIELSAKVLDSEAKLRSTLLHEMCHAAQWVLSHSSKPPHGPLFRKWADAAEASFPDIKVSSCHNYEIHFKFQWKCTNSSCGVVIGRHRKCIDVKRQVCGKCKSKLLYLGEISKEGASARKQTKPTEWSLFLKENAGDVKTQMKGASHKEVMKKLSEMYKETEESLPH